MARQYPNWVTPSRQAHLVRLFVVSRGFCVFGHPNCLIPEHHYEVFIENLVSDWVADDRQRREAEWKAERQIIHNLGERRYPLRGEFSNIARDIFHDKQPLFYLLGLGMSGLTFKPFAKVRLSSSFMVLYIDLGDTLKDISKTRRRKAIRYGKGLPIESKTRIDKLISLAVKHYQDH
jgi:hypothetical protein